LAIFRARLIRMGAFPPPVGVASEPDGGGDVCSLPENEK